MVKASYICTIVETEWSKFAHLKEITERRQHNTIDKPIFICHLDVGVSRRSSCIEIAKYMSTKTEVPDCERINTPVQSQYVAALR